MSKLSDNAIEWLANGKRGIASNTIFSVLTGVNALGNSCAAHPVDPFGFNRCRLLLEQVPELRQRFQEMRFVSREWAVLVDNWEGIEATFLIDYEKYAQTTGLSQNTYMLIQGLLDSVKMFDNAG